MPKENAWEDEDREAGHEECDIEHESVRNCYITFSESSRRQDLDIYVVLAPQEWNPRQPVLAADRFASRGRISRDASGGGNMRAQRAAPHGGGSNFHAR